MLKDNTIIAVFMRLVSVAFVVIVAALTGLSLVYHCKVDIYAYDLPRTIERHSPILYVLLAIGFIGVLLLIGHFVEVSASKAEKKWLAANWITAVCLLLTAAGSIFWILFNDGVPKSDQAILFNEARIMAGFSDAEYNTDYFGFYPRNRGLVLLIAGLLRVFGDTQMVFRWINVAGAIILLVSICASAQKAWNNARITAITSILLTVYYPIIVYTSYLYGTLLSAAFASCGIYAALRFCERKSIYAAIGSAVSFTLGIWMHQSAAIAMIAAFIYVLVHMSKETVVRTLLYVLLHFVVMISVDAVINSAYEKITGPATSEVVPVSLYFYMGITSENELGGPGSQDASMFDIYARNNYDNETANREAIVRLKDVIVEYLTGKRSLSFFVEKTKHQWLDPTFTCRRVMRLNEAENGEPVNSEGYTALYNSGIREIAFKLCIVYMIAIYGLNLFAGSMNIKNIQSVNLLFLIQIFLLGGFVFQLAWESIARYCFTYFIWLIPQAAFGVSVLYERMNERIRQKRPAQAPSL